MKLLVPITAAFAGTAAAGTVSIPITRDVPVELSNLRARRPNEVPLQHLGIRYKAKFTIGTPPQPFDIIVDTGSSDIYQNAVGTCTPAMGCEKQWNTSASSTFRKLGPKELNGDLSMEMSYAGGFLNATGTFGRDTVSFGGVSITNQIILLPSKTNIKFGVLGLGFNTSLSTYNRKRPVAYPTLLDNMVTQGAITKRAFSLYPSSGVNGSSLLLGGIDTEKFFDDLVTLPNIKLPYYLPQYDKYAVEIRDLTSKSIKGSKLSKPIAVMVDSGAPQCHFPKEVVDPIYKQYGAAHVNTGSSASGIVDCNQAEKQKDTVLEFVFKGKTIKVPGPSLVIDFWPGKLQDGIRKTVGDAAKDYSKVCFMGISLPPPGAVMTLGGPFLDQTYTVFDQDAYTISFAQVNPNPNGSHILEIPKKGALGKINGVKSAAAQGLVQAPVALMLLSTVVALLA